MRLRSILASILLVAVVALAPRAAHADRDEVQFGSNIVVPAGSSIHDAVCFFCSVNALGTIDHDVVVFFGSVHIAGQSNHDVVVFFGSVRADDNASIAHDIVNFFGSIRLGKNVSVGGDMVAMFGGVHAADSVTVGGSRVVQPGWVLLIPFLIIGGIITLIVNVIRNYRHNQLMAAGYGYPPQPPPSMPPQA